MRHLHPTRGEDGNTSVSPTPHSPQSTSSAAGHPGGGLSILGAKASANARPRLLPQATLGSLKPPRALAAAAGWGGSGGDSPGGRGSGVGSLSNSHNSSAATGDGEYSSPPLPKIAATLLVQSRNLAARRVEHRLRADMALAADCNVTVARRQRRQCFALLRDCTWRTSQRRSWLVNGMGKERSAAPPSIRRGRNNFGGGFEACVRSRLRLRAGGRTNCFL